MGFDSRAKFSLPNGSMDKNIIIFGVNMSSSVHIDNKKKDNLILCKGPIKGVDDTTLTAEAQYSSSFSRSNRKLCLSLHYDGSRNFAFVNATKIYQITANDSKIKNILYV